MRKKPRTFSRRSAAGTTLVEVVAGLALLGTLLVGLLMARARATRQAAAADRRLAAIAAADAILSSWHRDPRTLVRSGSGAIPDDSSLLWRSSLVANATIDDLGGQVVRLQIIDTRDGGVLASVDYVAEPPPKSEAAAGNGSNHSQAPPRAGRPHAPRVHAR